MKAADFGKPDLLAFMRKHRYAVISTCSADGAPQGALVGVATTDSMQLIFDTVSSSRKHKNLARDHRIAVTFCGPEEQTLQLQGLAHPVATSGPADSVYRKAYYLAWPDGRERLAWPNLSYWRISPRWARYSDFNRGPLIAEFHWDADVDPPLTQSAQRK
jgi:general stress protein 26